MSEHIGVSLSVKGQAVNAVYRIDGKQIRKSLGTSDLEVAKEYARQISTIIRGLPYRYDDVAAQVKLVLGLKNPNLKSTIDRLDTLRPLINQRDDPQPETPEYERDQAIDKVVTYTNEQSLKLIELEEKVSEQKRKILDLETEKSELQKLVGNIRRELEQTKAMSDVFIDLR